MYIQGYYKSHSLERKERGGPWSQCILLMPSSHKLHNGHLVPVPVSLVAAAARLRPRLERHEVRVHRARIREVRVVPCRVVQPHSMYAFDVRDPVTKE